MFCLSENLCPKTWARFSVRGSFDLAAAQLNFSKHEAPDLGWSFFCLKYTFRIGQFFTGHSLQFLIKDGSQVSLSIQTATK